VINNNHTSIMYSYGDMDPEIHPGHIFELLGSCDVIGHVTHRLPMVCFL